MNFHFRNIQLVSLTSVMEQNNNSRIKENKLEKYDCIPVLLVLVHDSLVV